MYGSGEHRSGLMGLSLAIAAGVVIGVVALSLLWGLIGFAMSILFGMARIALIVGLVAGGVFLVRALRTGRWSERI
jgi:hypothetical protein